MTHLYTMTLGHFLECGLTINDTQDYSAVWLDVNCAECLVSYRRAIQAMRYPEQEEMLSLLDEHMMAGQLFPYDADTDYADFTGWYAFINDIPDRYML